MVLQEKERKEVSVRKSWTENCCAIEVWISKETGAGEPGDWEDPRNQFDFLFLPQLPSNCISSFTDLLPEPTNSTMSQSAVGRPSEGCKC